MANIQKKATQNASVDAEQARYNKNDHAVNKDDKIVLKYIGQGTYKDRAGMLWSKDGGSMRVQAVRKINKQEYNNRTDLQFMIKYGTMVIES